MAVVDPSAAGLVTSSLQARFAGVATICVLGLWSSCSISFCSVVSSSYISANSLFFLLKTPISAFRLGAAAAISWSCLFCSCSCMHASTSSFDVDCSSSWGCVASPSFSSPCPSPCRASDAFPSSEPLA